MYKFAELLNRNEKPALFCKKSALT